MPRLTCSGSPLFFTPRAACLWALLGVLSSAACLSPEHEAARIEGENGVLTTSLTDCGAGDCTHIGLTVGASAVLTVRYNQRPLTPGVSASEGKPSRKFTDAAAFTSETPSVCALSTNDTMAYEGVPTLRPVVHALTAGDCVFTAEDAAGVVDALTVPILVATHAAGKFMQHTETYEEAPTVTLSDGKSAVLRVRVWTNAEGLGKGADDAMERGSLLGETGWSYTTSDPAVVILRKPGVHLVDGDVVRLDDADSTVALHAKAPGQATITASHPGAPDVVATITVVP